MVKKSPAKPEEVPEGWALSGFRGGGGGGVGGWGGLPRVGG